MDSSVDLVVHTARLLRSFDPIFGSQSPYCEILVDDNVVGRTATHKSGNLKPIWKQRFGVLLPRNATYLILRVHIEHAVRVPKLCGACYIPITAIPDKLTDFALKLEKREEKTGEIDVSIQIIAKTEVRARMQADIGRQLLSHLADIGAGSPKPQTPQYNVAVPHLPQPCAAPGPTADLKANILKGNVESMRPYAYQVFATFDTTAPPNSLQFHEYKAACFFIAQDLGVPSPGGEILARIFKKYDVDGDGVLNREEFFNMLSVLLRKVHALHPADEHAPANVHVSIIRNDHAPAPLNAQVLPKAAPKPPNQFPRPVPIAPAKVDMLRAERRFIDLYTFGRKLGEGAFGVVYQCKARLTKLERVCKVVNKAKCQMPLGEMKMEVKLLAQMDHPHILRVYEYFEDNQSFYFIFDPCEGGELMDVVKAANDHNMMLTEEWVTKVMRGTLLALGYVHKRHIMHKDLKLQNVLLLSRTNPYDDPHAIVIDFGLAEMFGDNHANTRVAGTPTYMAPEVWQQSFGPKCDVWSAGVMIFFLLTGQLPFSGTSMNELRARICGGMIPWQMLAHNTVEAREVVQSMLQVDDSQRPSASRLVSHSWFADTDGNEKRKVHLSKDILQNLSKVAEMAEFGKAVSQMVAGQLSNKHMNDIMDIFKALDVHNNGVLSRQELSVGLRKLGIDEATIPKVASALDSNNTGQVSYTEFCGGMLAGSYPPRSRALIVDWISTT